MKFTWREARPGELFFGGSGVLIPLRVKPMKPSPNSSGEPKEGSSQEGAAPLPHQYPWTDAQDESSGETPMEDSERSNGGGTPKPE